MRLINYEIATGPMNILWYVFWGVVVRLCTDLCFRIIWQGLISLLMGARKCLPYQLYVYVQFKKLGGCICNKWAPMPINLAHACCRQPIYGPWPIIFTFVFQTCEILIHWAHQHGATKQSASETQPNPSLVLRNILTLMFRVETLFMTFE
jgi:hypothetical protein